MVKIAPSILSADFARLAEEIVDIEKKGADVIHLDIMDGHFVPNLTFGAPLVKALRKYTSLPFDVHLMVTNPEDHIRSFVEAGAQFITVHFETTHHLHKLIHEIKNYNVKAGVSLNPSTPIYALEEIADQVDLILIMSVNPGFGGQSFIPQTVDKIRRVKDLLEKKGNKEAIIEVDGGINEKTAPLVVEAGATLLVAGSAVFNASDREAAIQSLRM